MSGVSSDHLPQDNAIMRRSIVLLAAALAACGGQDTLHPQDRVIATGSYAYEGRWLHPVTMEWDTIRGQLTVDVSTPDSVHGNWLVGGFLSDSTAGYWNENAYVIRSLSQSGRITLTHRLWRIGSASQLLCTLSYREESNNADPVVTSGSCDTDAIP